MIMTGIAFGIYVSNNVVRTVLEIVIRFVPLVFKFFMSSLLDKGILVYFGHS